jgi:hypothetical protein
VEDEGIANLKPQIENSIVLIVKSGISLEIKKFSFGVFEDFA